MTENNKVYHLYGTELKSDVPKICSRLVGQCAALLLAYFLKLCEECYPVHETVKNLAKTVILAYRETE